MMPPISIAAVVLTIPTYSSAQTPTAHDIGFDALYPAWNTMGGEIAQVFEPRPIRIRLEVAIEVSPEGGACSELTIRVPVPPNTPSQWIRDIAPLHADHSLESDDNGQPVLLFSFKDVAPGTSGIVGWELEADISKVIHPMDVLEQCVDTSLIPSEIAQTYTQDGEKYDITSEAVRQAARDVLASSGSYPEAVWNAYSLVADNVEYVRDGQHDPAPAVLAQGTGSCSEYSYTFIAICRAAGIPARYVTGTVWSTKNGGVDDIFHRWAEVWFPGYGWVPFDSTWGRLTPAKRAANFGVQQDTKFAFRAHWGRSELLRYGAVYRYEWKSAESKNKAQVQTQPTAYWTR